MNEARYFLVVRFSVEAQAEASCCAGWTAAT